MAGSRSGMGLRAAIALVVTCGQPAMTPQLLCRAHQAGSFRLCTLACKTAHGLLPAPLQRCCCGCCWCAGLELGRGKRQRGTAAYRDINERDFNKLCQEGADVGQAPVPLLAPAAAAASAAPAAPGAGQTAAAAKRRRVADPRAAPAPAAAGQAARGARAAAAQPLQAQAAAIAPPAIPVSRPVPAVVPSAPVEAAGAGPAEVAAVVPEAAPQQAREPAEPAQQELVSRPLGAKKAAERRQQKQARAAPTGPGEAAAEAEPEPKRRRTGQQEQERAGIGSRVAGEGPGSSGAPVHVPPGDSRAPVEPPAKRSKTEQGASATGVAPADAPADGPAASSRRQCSNCGSLTTSGNKWRKHPGTGVRGGSR